MNFSDKEIKPKRVMYVNFVPVKPNEFGGKHLAVIIKNNGDKTAIVVPLTSIGPRDNKIQIELPKQIAGFPDCLKIENTYAALDNLRTVQYQGNNHGDGRFTDIMSDSNLPIYVEINDSDFYKIIEGCVLHLEKHMQENHKLKLHLGRVKAIQSISAINLAYQIKKTTERVQIDALQEQIRELLHISIDYHDFLAGVDIDNEIDEIIESALAHNLSEIISKIEESTSIYLSNRKA